MIFKLNCSLNKINQNARDANIKTERELRDEKRVKRIERKENKSVRQRTNQTHASSIKLMQSSCSNSTGKLKSCELECIQKA